MKYWQVGGYVRDRLLCQQRNQVFACKDLDYVVEAPSYAAMVQWIQQRAEIFLESPEYFTVRAKVVGDLPADFVLARCDGNYLDGRRPDSVQVGTLLDDLARRDFTVNAIAYSPETGEYVDPHNGIADLRAETLRCVGVAHERFNEDALRLLRAVRFHLCKRLSLHHEIVNCLNDAQLCAKLKNSVSEERKREELLKCFNFNTLATLQALHKFPNLCNACFGKKLWLKPTLEER